MLSKWHCLYQNSKHYQWIRRVWRYQRGNQNPYIEEEQTTQWPKEKSTKGQTTIHITEDRVTQTPLKTGGGLRSYNGQNKII